jgi:membrane protease YdiL (CAAX protease family)
MHGELPPRRYRVLGLVVLVEGGLGVLALALGWLLGQPPLATWAWDVDAALPGVAACLPMLLLFLVCVSWPVGPLARIKQITRQVIRPLFASCTVIDLAGVALLAGLGEEMLFRGVLQAALADWLGAGAGLAAASLLFGLLHAITPTYAVLATLLGAYLGWVWMASGNLLAPVVAHALYDFVALLYLVRQPAADT